MKERNIIWIITVVTVLAAATLWVWKLHGFPRTGIDDANIFFTYAENLASGNGITYGQNGERVEGFTSLLWMLLCAVMFIMGWNEWGVFACSFLLFAGTQFLILRAIRDDFTSEASGRLLPLQILYLVLVLLSPAYATWMTITLMDTCLWSFTVAAMAVFLVSPPQSKTVWGLASLPFVLAPAVRPEALLIAPVFLGLLWLRCLATGVRHATRLCLLIAGLCVVGVLGSTLFRMSYFGYPFPNTYYAKVSPSLAYNLREGKLYLRGFVLSGPLIGLFLLLLGVQCASWIGQLMDKVRHSGVTALIKPSMSAAVAVGLGACSLLLVPVLTGGDHFALFRFFQPAYPLICLAVILALKELQKNGQAGALRFLEWKWWRERFFMGGAVSLVVGYWVFAYASDCSWSSMRWGSPLSIEFRIVKGGVETGARLNRLFRDTAPRPSVGVMAAGSIGRTYEGKILDIFGLNSSYIAHFKGDRKGKKNHAAFEREAFYGVEPDILLALRPSATNDPGVVCLKGLLEDPRFTGRWRYGTVSRGDSPGEVMTLFVRNTFVEKLGKGNVVEFRDTMVWSNGWVEVSGGG